MRTEFESKLKEEGYSYNINPDEYYTITPINRIELPIKVQLGTDQINIRPMG